MPFTRPSLLILKCLKPKLTAEGNLSGLQLQTTGIELPASVKMHSHMTSLSGHVKLSVGRGKDKVLEENE